MLKIVFTGPESTGKTALAKRITDRWTWASLSKEFARFYLSEKLRTQGTAHYTFEELTRIAHGQVMVEESALSRTEMLVVCDTDLITLKVWSNVVFKKCDKRILEMIDNWYNTDLYYQHKRHYFLCSPEEFDWQPDPLRENPFDRDRLFDIYEKELQYYKRNYTILRGPFQERLYTVFEKVDELLDSPY